MALTIDVLRANAALAGLTDEQLTAITTLSVNDENSVIAKKTGEIYGGLDADILAVSGIAKNGTEKTFDYAKRVLTEFKTKVEGANGLQSQIDSLTKEKGTFGKSHCRRCDGCGNRKGIEASKGRFAKRYDPIQRPQNEIRPSRTNPHKRGVRHSC